MKNVRRFKDRPISASCCSLIRAAQKERTIIRKYIVRIPCWMAANHTSILVPLSHIAVTTHANVFAGVPEGHGEGEQHYC